MGEIINVDKPINNNNKALNTDPWQSTLQSITEKWLHVWNNKLFTDVAFIVGADKEEIIECHKILLILHSPVFETMFGQRWGPCNNSSVAGKTEQICMIPLPDEEPEIFKFFLEFVYTGSFSATDIDKLVSTLVLGKKYMCQQLVKKCIEMLTDSLTVQNVMSIYQVASAENMDEPDLNKATEEYILHNANSLFTSGEITKINKTDLCKLLQNDELNVAEIELFNACYSWGKSECAKIVAINDVAGENLDSVVLMREILRDIVPLIRFTNMTPEDFSLQVVPKNILALEDTVTIFRFMTTPQEKREDMKPELDLKFNTTKRSLSYFVYNLRRLKGHGFDFGIKYQNFSFKVDRDIRIISLGFFRAIEPNVVLEIGVKILNQEMTEIFAEILETNVKCLVSEDVFHIKFKTPVRISKETLYTISYIVKGKETFYKTVGESTIAANCGAEGKVTFQFREAIRDNDFDQVPEICFRL